MKLGFLGGTFDPIHLGHLLIAEQAREALGLDRVLLVPAARPPHKPGVPTAPYASRLEMCRLALEGVPGLEASDLEQDPDRPSFTVESLRGIAGWLPPGSELWLLLGGDSLRDLPSWREPEEIQRLARLAVYARDRVLPDASSTIPVTWLPGPRLELSSTEIRERVRLARSIRFLVPEPVRGFIRDQGLYRGGAA